MLTKLSFLLVTIGFFHLMAQDTAGVGGIAGKVSREGEGAGLPLAGARVCIAELQRCAISDSSGNFRLAEIRAGRYTLEVQPAGEPVLRQPNIEVRAGIYAGIEITVPVPASLRQEITVSDSILVAPEEVKGTSFLVQQREVLKAAGTLQDVSRYLQTLPGVVIGSNDFRNDLIVRGGSPLENLFVIDNVEIPNINNFANFGNAGGPVTMLDANLLQDVNFLTGGFPAPFTNRLSSVLQITQREGDRERFRSQADVAFAGAGLILEGPLKSKKGSWVVSARRSFLDFFTDDIGFGGVPVNYNLNAKAVYDISPRDRVWFVNVTGYDFLNTRIDPEDPNDTTTVQYRGWRSGAGLNWQRLFGSRGVGLLGLTHSEASVRESQNDLRFGNNEITFRDTTREGETTVKYDLTLEVPVLKRLQAGGNLKLFRVDLRVAKPFGLESDFSDQIEVPSYDFNNQFRVIQPAAYIQSTQNLTKRLSLTWGGRFDHYRYLDATRLSPRAGASYRLTDRLSWRGSWGTYYQQPVFFITAAFPQNRNLLPMRADHVVTGFTFLPTSTVRVTLEGYYKRYRDYPVTQAYPQFTLANAGDSFGQDEILLPYVSGGRGRVRGLELFVEKKFSNKWYGQTNFSWSRARHAGIDGVLRPGSFDYPIVFNVVGGYQFNPKWEFGVRSVYLTGRPTTPVDTILSSEQRRIVLDTARYNSVRARNYFRFDFRVDRTFIVADRRVVLFGGLQNTTNRKNFVFPDWNRTTNQQEEDTQLGLFPIVGLNWRF